MSPDALVRPPLGNGGQLLIPPHLSHVGGWGLRSPHSPLLLSLGNLASQLIVLVNNDLLGILRQLSDQSLVLTVGIRLVKRLVYVQ